MKRWLSFLRLPQVLWACLLTIALLAGCLNGLEHWLILFRSPAVFGSYVIPPIDTHRHVLFPQMREIADGHWLTADPLLYEHRDGPPLTAWPWLPPVLYAFFWNLFGSVLWLPLSSLVVGSISFLFLQQIITEITKRRVLGVLFALLTFFARLWPVMFFPGNGEEVRALVGVFIPGSLAQLTEHATFLSWESYNPTFLLLGPLFLYVHRAMSTGRTRLLLPVGAASGLLLYCYPFHWIYFFVVIGLCGLWYGMRRRWLESFHSMGGLALNVLVTVPFWWNQFLLRQSGVLAAINLRNAALELGRYVRTSQWQWYVVWAGLSILIFLVARRKQERGTGAFLIVLFAALFVCLNMQVIIGFNMQPDHWISKILLLPLGWALAYLFSAMVDWGNRRRHVRPLFASLLLASLVFGASLGFFQETTQSVQHQIMYPVMTADVWSALRWMDKNLPADSVVLSLSPMVNAYMTIYTSAYSYVPHAYSTLASQEEVMNRFISAYAFFGVPASFMRDALASNHAALQATYPTVSEVDGDLGKQIFLATYRPTQFDASLRGYPVWSVPEAVIDQVIQDYTERLEHPPDPWTTYRVDYLLTTDYDQLVGTVELSAYPQLTEVFRSGHVRVYQFQKDGLEKPNHIR